MKIFGTDLRPTKYAGPAIYVLTSPPGDSYAL